MNKWIRTGCFFTVCSLLSLSATAQEFSFKSPLSSSTSPPAKNIVTAPEISPAMSPDQFKNRVSTLQEQNHATLLQQTTSTLAKQPPITVPPAQLNTPSSFLNKPIEDTSDTDTPTPPPPIQKPAQSQPVATPSTIPDPAAAPQALTPPPQPQTPAYTGFQGSGGATTGKPNTAPKPEGGWNVKY